MRLNKEDLPPTDGEWKYNRHASSWYSLLNMQVHNSLGPAIIYDRGEIKWWINGKTHRLDGPAEILSNGTKRWFVNGRYVPKESFPSAVISFLLGVDREIAKLLEQEIKR